MDGDPPQLLLQQFILNIQFSPPTADMFIALGIILFLLLASALMSAAEIAYFSLTPYELEDCARSEDERLSRVAGLMENPRYLLSTLLVTNNIVNIGVVIFTHFVIKTLIHFSPSQLWGFTFSEPTQELLLNVVVDVFVLILFAEVIPKVYATQNKIPYARAVVPLMEFLSRFLRPVNFLLVGSTRALEQKLRRRNMEVDRDEINKAIDMTVDPRQPAENARLLKGIVHFGNLNVKQVMHSRMEIAAVRSDLPFRDLMEKVQELGYSRLPVYTEDVDNIIGILHVKDLLAHLAQDQQFNWRKLVREPLFVPENKKIDDLLREFQESRKHLAIVVDEFGGTAGIITLEDVMEQVVGEIKDEFDDAGDVNYKQLDDRRYIFEGKTLLLDMCRILQRDPALFEEARGEAESLAGLVIEVLGRIPRSGDEVMIEQFTFKVLSVKNNRIEKLKITLP